VPSFACSVVGYRAVLDLEMSCAACSGSSYLLPVLGSFAGRTLLGTQAGMTLGEAAKAAIGPSLSVMASHDAGRHTLHEHIHMSLVWRHSSSSSRTRCRVKNSVVVVPCLMV
jgi:hypothetical protein